MNRSKIAAELPLRLRAFCAQTSTRANVRPEYASPQQLLEDASMRRLLQKSNLSARTRIDDKDAKLCILAHLSETCKIPVASDAFLKMHTAEDMATWYSEELKPCRARPHARNLIRHTLADSGDCEEIDDRIDLDREKVQVEVESRIPANVVLDERTFLKVDKPWVRRRSLPKRELGSQ